MNNQTTITFVIPHRGRVELLKKTVASIVSQADITNTLTIEVVVVTQNSDLSLDIRNLSELRKLRIISGDPSVTISALRNTGVAMSESEHLAFIDADMELSADWAASMIKELSIDSRRIIVSAHERMPDNPTALEKIRVLLNNQSTDTTVPFLTGRNLFLRRESFDRIGGFPEHLITAEDYFFTAKASQLGTLFISSQAWAIHLGEDKNFGEMFTKEIWRSRSNFQSIKNRHVPLSELPSLVAPLLIASAIPATVAIFFAALPPILFLIPAGFLFLPVMAYSIRCYRICGHDVSIAMIVVFYCTYFAARGVGVYRGIVDLIKSTR